MDGERWLRWPGPGPAGEHRHLDAGAGGAGTATRCGGDCTGVRAGEPCGRLAGGCDCSRRLCGAAECGADRSGHGAWGWPSRGCLCGNGGRGDPACPAGTTRLRRGRRFGRRSHRRCRGMDHLPRHADPGGGNGELHAAVSAGPMFNHPIGVEVGVVADRAGLVFADPLAPDSAPRVQVRPNVEPTMTSAAATSNSSGSNSPPSHSSRSSCSGWSGSARTSSNSS
jgi:hypothetical protein